VCCSGRATRLCRAGRRCLTTARVKPATRRIRVLAVLLVVALAAGPAATHLYWMLGGTWGLDGAEASIGIRTVAALVVLLIVAAMLVVLARVGLWQQKFVSYRVIRSLAWGLGAFYLGHGLVSLAEGWAGILDEWWLYGPGGLVIGSLALVVAGSGGAWRAFRRPHWTQPSH
jgi:hypothetical protein